MDSVKIFCIRSHVLADRKFDDRESNEHYMGVAGRAKTGHGAGQICTEMAG
jgi:hypothetical protein